MGASGPGVSGGSAISPQGWRFNICDDPERCLVEPKDGTSRWYRRMWQDPRFRAAAAERWAALRAGPWSDGALRGLIGGAAGELGAAVGRNYAKFPGALAGSAGWQSEVDFLQSWLLEHVGWMDGALREVAAGAAAASTAGR